MSKLFESQWKATKSALLEGADLTHNQDGTVNENKLQMMDVMFENTRRALTETATLGATNVGNVAQLYKVILPVIRRVMPTVIAHEIIGVQPLQGPVAQIHTLRVRYADSVAGGVSAGAEALAPLDIARYYSGDVTNVATPQAAATANLEGVPGNRLSLQVLRQTVEAKSRKLSARWTIEASQDAKSQHGIDIESEIMSALAQEITAEIDQEILMSLRALPGAPTSTFSQATATGTPTFIGDLHAALAIMIMNQANLIASRTRRGAGNWAVVSPQALTMLQSAQTSGFARSTNGTFDAPTNTKFVGTLNNSIKVYVDQYANATTPVLVGYKGSEADAAAFYCPYVPLTSSGVVMDPSTFEPVVSFMTRYGYVELTNTANSLGNARDYLGLVGIANDISFH